MRSDKLAVVQAILSGNGVNYITRRTSRIGEPPYQFKVVITSGYVSSVLRELNDITANFPTIEITNEGMVLS